MLLGVDAAPKESGLSVLVVENDEIFAWVVIPPPKVKLDELLWDKTVVTGASKPVVAFGFDPNEGVGLLNDEFALPNDGGCGFCNKVEGLPKATEATD